MWFCLLWRKFRLHAMSRRPLQRWNNFSVFLQTRIRLRFKNKSKKEKKIRQISSFWTQDGKFRNRVKYLCWYQRMHAAGASMSGKCWMCKCWRKLLMCLQRGILWGWRRKLPRFLNPFTLIILKIELKWKKNDRIFGIFQIMMNVHMTESTRVQAYRLKFAISISKI